MTKRDWTAFRIPHRLHLSALSSHWCALTAIWVPKGFVITNTSPASAASGLKIIIWEKNFSNFLFAQVAFFDFFFIGKSFESKSIRSHNSELYWKKSENRSFNQLFSRLIMMKNLGIPTFWKCLFVNLTEVLNNQKEVIMKFVFCLYFAN